MTLYDLARIILLIEKEPISKVRFAKTIYFVHKELIKRGFSKESDFMYVRMPLGPVPFGFMTLNIDFSDIITRSMPSGLSYNSTVYSTPQKRLSFSFKKNPLHDAVLEILQGLRKVSTSELIEISHQDPSWIEHPNGYVYEVSKQDLSNPVPVKGSRNRPTDENQLIQASLVKGMIEDIVSESTDLEFPDDNKGY